MFINRWRAVSLLQLTVLALVQGITEFLPISSSGHLIVASGLAGWPDQGLVIDIAVHVGTLGAVMLYCWRDLVAMAGGVFRLVTRGRRSREAALAGYVVLATLPLVAAGYFLKDLVSGPLRSAEVIAWATIGFGVLLYVVDRSCLRIRTVANMTVNSAVMIGLAQILALIPGTSRSGITMTAGRLLGFERVDAARFSLLLSIPAILGAGTLAGRDLAASGDLALTHDALIAAGLAFVAALVAIVLMMRWLARASFTPFVVYRLLFGGYLLYWVYG